MTSLAGPDGVTRTWTYDTVVPTLLRSESHLESGTVTFADYDDAGLLEHRQDANGTVTTYQYDGNERLEQVTQGTLVTTVTYEPGSDNRQQVAVDGVITDFTYDDAGRLQTRIDTVDGKPFVTAFAYDGNDNLAEVTYPSGRKVAYAYGAESRLTRVYNPVTQADYATDFPYHPSGAPLSYKSGNNLVTTFTYDTNRYWLTGITIPQIMQLGYSTHDGVGNVRTVTADGFGTQALTYDVLDRLATAEGPYGPLTFAYDAHGNRLGSFFGYDPVNRFRLTSYDGMPMSYDSNGNMRTRSADTFDYTPDNLVKSATVGGVTTNYGYDADAWRVRKTVGSGPTTYYVRGPNGQLLMEWVNASPTATVREYIYAGSRLIAVMKGDAPAK